MVASMGSLKMDTDISNIIIMLFMLAIGIIRVRSEKADAQAWFRNAPYFIFAGPTLLAELYGFVFQPTHERQIVWAVTLVAAAAALLVAWLYRKKSK